MLTFDFMKRIAIVIASVFLSTLFIFGGGQFTIGKMVCLGSGHAAYSFGHAKDCCDHKLPAHPVISSKCCDLKNVSYNLNDFNLSQKINIASFNFISILPQFAVCNLQSLSFFSENIFSHTDLPPPFTGKELIYLFRSLLL